MRYESCLPVGGVCLLDWCAYKRYERCLPMGGFQKLVLVHNC